MKTPSNLSGISQFRIMLCGDSITAGVGSTSTGGYRSSLMQSMINTFSSTKVEFVGSDSVNIGGRMCGTSGLTTAELAASRYLGSQVKAYKPDVITILIGANDCTQLHNLTPGYPTLAQSRASYTAMLDAIRVDAPYCVVFACKAIDNNTAGAEVIAYNDAIFGDILLRSDYQSGLIKIVDTYTDVGPYSAINYADGTHPNYNGYLLISNSIKTAFRTYY